MTRFFHPFLLFLALLPALLAADDSRPNILFIAVDDLKPLTVWSGSETVKTPDKFLLE